MSTSTPVLRYAPSPTGWLHVGNALAALLTYTRAKRQQGRCFLRIEDLDTPRVMPGAAAAMVEDTVALGLHFDSFVPAANDIEAQRAVVDGVVWQSRRTAAYEAALGHLVELGLVYACRCSRKELARLASAPHVGDDGPAYPGTCRDLGLPLDATDVALRVRMDAMVALARHSGDAPVIVDRLCGPLRQDVVAEVGDIVVRRRDGLFSYQLAVVVDDAWQGVTEVCRARDLLSSAPRQALLHRALGYAPPAFAHLPLLVDEHGHRLSKRSPQAPGLLRTVLGNRPVEALLGHFLWLLGRGDEGRLVSLDAFVEAVDDDAMAVPTIHWRAPRG